MLPLTVLRTQISSVLNTEGQVHEGIYVNRPKPCNATCLKLGVNIESTRPVLYVIIYKYGLLVGLQDSVLSVDVPLV